VGAGRGTRADGARLVDLTHLVFVLACAVTGGLVARHRPGNPVGWLLLGSAAGFAALEACGRAALHTGDPPSPVAAALGWPQTWLWVPANALLTVVPVFFPDGRAPSRRWRPALRGLCVLALVTAVLSALRPGPDVQLGISGRPNPLGVPGLGPAADTAAVLFAGAAALVFVSAGFALVKTLPRVSPPRRQQVEWLAYAAGLAALAVLGRLAAGLLDDDPAAVWPVGSLFWDLLGSSAAALLPLAVGVAIVRHRLFDIDLLISRTVLLVVLSGAVVGIYLAVVAVAGAVLWPALGPATELPASLLGVGLAAILFAPLRTWLQRRVDRALYGDRCDPYGVLARLGRQLELVQDAVTLLTQCAATVREALQLSHVAIEVADGRRVALGTEPSVLVGIPLVAGGEQVGRLELGPRPGETALGRRDLRLLHDLARPIAGAVRAVRSADRAAVLAADLQQSRERLVIAREEERRRLRRDLHDGLGPTLAGLTMRADTALQIDDTALARTLLAEIVVDAQTAVADVRRLVEGLRPPTLDAMGLVGAIRAHLAGLPVGAPAVALDAPDDLPALPAATEVAAYRIAVEALNNVIRHAGADTATVGIGLDGDRLVLEVADDGRGRRPSDPDGVGVASMRERAAELGGDCTVTGRAAGGTRVRAELPARIPVGDRGAEGDHGTHPHPAGR
jgi:signal transduction histidine kinase